MEAGTKITVQLPKGAYRLIRELADKKELGENIEETAEYLLMRAIDDLLRKKT